MLYPKPTKGSMMTLCLLFSWLISFSTFGQDRTLTNKDEVASNFSERGSETSTIVISLNDTIKETLFTNEAITTAVNVRNTSQDDLIINASIEITDEISNARTSDLPEDVINDILVVSNVNLPVDMVGFIQRNYGLSATQIKSNEIPLTDIQNYELVIILGEQGRFYYDDINESKAVLEDYVRNGGVLQIQVSSASSGSASTVDLVGGASAVYPAIESVNVIVDPNHPAVEGLPSLIDNSTSGPRVSTHVLENLPENAHVIVETQSTQLPTMAEYAYGFGTVIATGMALERLHSDRDGNYKEMLGKFFENSILKIREGRELDFPIINDTIPAGETKQLEIPISAQNLSAGFYATTLNIETSDSANPLVTIPVELTVLSAINDLFLSATCVTNPSVEKSWLINNPNDFEVNAFWSVENSDLSDSITLQPGANDFITPFISSNRQTLTISWLNELGVQQERSASDFNIICRVKGPILTPVCSDNPELFRKWEVVNRNPFDISLDWVIIQSDISGTHNATPGSSFFFTDAKEGDNIIQILWLDRIGESKRQRKLSNDTPCNIRGLVLNSVCTEATDNFKRWEIVNRNPFSVSLEWNILGTSNIESLSVAQGSTFLNTDIVAGDNILKIVWSDEEGNTKRQQKLSDAGICNSGVMTINNEASGTIFENSNTISDISNSVNVFPNPFQGSLTMTVQLDNNESEDYIVQIHNMLGGLVYKHITTSSYGTVNLQIDTEDFAKGSYVLTLVSQNKADEIVNRLLIRQ